VPPDARRGTLTPTHCRFADDLYPEKRRVFLGTIKLVSDASA
jgi:hypothetical protein